LSENFDFSARTILLLYSYSWCRVSG